MSEIFAIRNNLDCHKELDLNTIDVARYAPDNADLDGIMDFSFLNISMAAWWDIPPVKFLTVEGLPACSNPDISVWAEGGSLVLSPKAYNDMGNMLRPSGEFLPITVDGETWYIFNCLTLGEADEEKSRFEYAGETKLGLEYLEFKASAADLLIFKTKLENCVSLFCGDRLKEAIEAFDLSGVTFDKNLIEVFY